MYVLESKPQTPNEAYDTLETVFGGGSFDGRDAADALMEVMELTESEAQRELSTLLRLGVIVEE